MTNPITDNDLVSLDLAERLAKLRLRWEKPDIGHWAVFQGKGAISPMLVTGVAPIPKMPGKLQIQLTTGWWLQEELTWLPRRIDCEVELVKVGYTAYKMLHFPSGLYSFSTLSASREIIKEALTAAEAIGLALEQAMKGARSG